jgi:dolichol-phosphate mannosyltransferase
MIETPARPLSEHSSGAPLLSVVIPTFNERGNIGLLIERLGEALRGIAWEAIVVDDNSPDGTAAAVRALASTQANVRCIRRIGRRGLSGACIEGMLASSAPYVAVMDADLQHDERKLPQMLQALQTGAADLVVGSRYVAGGSADAFDQRRLGFSSFATRLAQRMLGIQVADPMSGFFAMRRDRFDALAPDLSVQGFKILLDIIASARGALRVVEVPYVFGTRQHGESKLDSLVALDFLGLLVAKLTRDVVSLRFLMFAMVGASGLFVHFAALYAALQAGLAFAAAQAIAATVAMTTNFLLNNFLTYRDQRLSGWRLIKGLVLFYVVCAVGLMAIVGVAFSVYDQEPIWWLAGAAGALMGVVWNYGISGLLVWRRRQ